MSDRLYIYLPARSREERQAKPRFDPIPIEREVVRVWSMAAGRHDPEYKHDPDVPLIHHQTAFMHDLIHDWTWRDGKLDYHPAIRDGGEWLAIELAPLSLEVTSEDEKALLDRIRRRSANGGVKVDALHRLLAQRVRNRSGLPGWSTEVNSLVRKSVPRLLARWKREGLIDNPVRGTWLWAGK